MPGRADPDGEVAVGGGYSQEALEALWLSPTRTDRLSALNREAIVATAVALADNEGIDAVSIRRVAGLLDARPMSLYSHVGRKQDLLALMVDEAVRSCLVPGELPADWREALRLVAEHTRDAVHRHPWILNIKVKTTSISPNAVRHLEQTLAALTNLDVTRARKLAIMAAVDTFTMGHVFRELSKLSAWQTGDDGTPVSPLREIRGYLSRLIEDGDFPQLAAFGLDAIIETHETETEAADRRFTEGLTWLLDGIAASLAAERA